MELNHLRIFQAVAQAGSVSRAARDLNCVQSNVTARIKGLESELGAKLFYRRPKGMTLTGSGRILLGYAGQILHLEKEAKTAVLDDDQIRGRLLLGGFEAERHIDFKTPWGIYKIDYKHFL